jgi:hypothetical protein
MKAARIALASLRTCAAMARLRRRFRGGVPPAPLAALSSGPLRPCACCDGTHLQRPADPETMPRHGGTQPITHDAARQLVLRTLQRQGADVVRATWGAEAWQLLDELTDRKATA